jgi:hypothetical protein
LDARGLREGLLVALAEVPSAEGLLALAGVGGGDFGDGARVPGGGLDPGLDDLRREAGEGEEQVLGRSPLTSIINTGMRSRRASSTMTVRRPVLPLPVMPATTA